MEVLRSVSVTSWDDDRGYESKGNKDGGVMGRIVFNIIRLIIRMPIILVVMASRSDYTYEEFKDDIWP